MKSRPWHLWLALLLLLALAAAGCSASNTLTTGVTVAGTIKVSDGTVPSVAVLNVLDSNNVQVATTGITGIRSDTGAYSLRLPGPGTYKFVIIATNIAGRSLSKTTPDVVVNGDQTLLITLSPAGSGTAATADDQFDIGRGSQSLQPA